MPTLSQPELLPGPFAYNGDKNDIPDASASLGAASYQQGFPPITQLPVNAGGIPPQRNDFNGILNALSQHTFWQQSGGMYAWSATLDYAVPSMVVGSDKEIYFALQSSGPGTAAGAKNPTSGEGKAYWQNIAYVLPVATATNLGGVMVNKGGLQVSASGLLSLLLMQGGGLNLNATGQLYVDTADFSEEMLRAFLEGIIAEGGGLGFDQAGKLYVDADAFSDDLLERFLKSIRVPIWLTGTTQVYVAPDGVDSAADGRGFSAAKPWATLQYALNYMASNYNLDKYVLYINVAAGEYGESGAVGGNGIYLPTFTHTSGQVVIHGAGMDETIIYGYFSNVSASSNGYQIRDLTIKQDTTSSSNFIYCTTLEYEANVQFQRVHFIFAPQQGKINHEIIRAISGRIVFGSYNALSNLENACKISIAVAGCLSVLSATENGAQIFVQTPVTIDGTFTSSGAVVRTTNSGYMSFRALSSSDTQGKLLQGNGTVSGKRAGASFNSIIRLPDGQGIEQVVPGTEGAVTNTGGQIG